jgi:hypothetical protein
MTYNPFKKNIGEVLTADDLKDLLSENVSEGYYVEFKETFRTNLHIARSIASFANTYGGWYIVGVKTNSQNVATDICGFDLSSYPDPISKVREVTKSNIDPTPIFYTQLIALEGNRGVLTVYVPTGQETPFITKDGRIYRRVADSSDPISETNRYALDRLVDRGREVIKHFKKFCKDERTFMRGQSDTAWVNIFLSPYPLDIMPYFELPTGEKLRELLDKTKTPVKVLLGEENSFDIETNIPFNSGKITHRSFILRQVQPENIALNTVTIELFNDGRAKFLLPIDFMQPIQEGSIKSDRLRWLLESYNADQLDLLRFFDVGRLWGVISYVLTFHQLWLDQKQSIDLRVAVTLKNIWQSVPFVDSDDYATYIEECGLPISQTDLINLPDNSGYGMILSQEPNKSFWPMVASIIAQAFGLPTELLASSYTKFVFSHHSLKAMPGGTEI